MGDDNTEVLVAVGKLQEQFYALQTTQEQTLSALKALHCEEHAVKLAVQAERLAAVADGLKMQPRGGTGVAGTTGIAVAVSSILQGIFMFFQSKSGGGH